MDNADKIILSDSIFTGKNLEITSGGIAIKGNKILDIADRVKILEYKEKNTVIIDYGNKTVLAGFCDAHVHVLMGSLFCNEPQLTEAKSQEEAAGILKKYYDANREDYRENDWILGFSWYQVWWDDQSLPVKESLDRYFPDKPVFLFNADCHGAWVNSRALEIAGITKDSGEIAYGTVMRDSNGEPTGYLDEQAMAPCVKHAFILSESKEKYLYSKYLRVFTKSGVTSVNDMQFIYGIDMGSKKVYQSMADHGELPIRINFATGLLGDLNYIKSLKQKYKGGKVHYNGVKEFLDGIIFTHTSTMLEKYSDAPEAKYIYNLVDYQALEERVIDIQEEGINIHLHATGDGAVRFALDCYEKAVNLNGKNDARLSIEHLDLVNKRDFERLGKYDVIASVQPQHLGVTDSYKDNPYPLAVGEERAKFLWAYRSMQAGGGTLAFGTDFPTVVDVNPLLAIHRAVTRLHNDGTPEGGWNPREKLTLKEALTAYTYGGAYMSGRENELGTLEPGKLADITVLDRNIFDLENDDELLEVTVELTVCDGKIEYIK